MSDQGQDTQKKDTFNNGAIYESYVGRWSRPVADEFLSWLNIPANAHWLDVGCGTGALSETILKLAHPAAIRGIDPSDGFIAFARQQVIDERVNFEVGDAQHLPVESGNYDAIVAGLCLNFIPDQGKAVREMVRAAKPGGTVAAYVWDYAEKMEFMRYFWDAVIALHPDSLELDESQRFPICQPEPLGALFRDAGLANVEVRNIDVPTHFRDFDDYWTPFLGGQGSAPTYVSRLNDDQRNELRDYIRAHLPINEDGSIDLIARAWAVRGLRPL